MVTTAAQWVEDHLAALFARDWAAVDRLYADDVVLEDHRRFVAVDRFAGRAEMLAGSKSIVEIGAAGCDAEVLSERGSDTCLARLRYYGRGAELTVLNVFALDAEGRLARSDVYEVDDLDLARVRLAGGVDG